MSDPGDTTTTSKALAGLALVAGGFVAGLTVDDQVVDVQDVATVQAVDGDHVHDLDVWNCVPLEIEYIDGDVAIRHEGGQRYKITDEGLHAKIDTIAASLLDGGSARPAINAIALGDLVDLMVAAKIYRAEYRAGLIWKAINEQGVEIRTREDLVAIPGVGTVTAAQLWPLVEVGE